MTELNSLLFYPKNSGNRAKQHDWARLYRKKTKNSLLIRCLTGNLYGRHAAKTRFEKIGVLGLETGYSQRVPEKDMRKYPANEGCYSHGVGK